MGNNFVLSLSLFCFCGLFSSVVLGFSFSLGDARNGKHYWYLVIASSFCTCISLCSLLQVCSLFLMNFSTLTCCKEYENEAAANSVQVRPVYINCETFFGSTAATKGPWRVRTERITSSETRGWWFAGTFLQIGPGLKTAQFRGLKAKMPRNASDFVRTYSNL